MNEALGVLAAILSSLIGGTTIVGTRMIVGDLDALTVATIRHTIGALCLAPVAIFAFTRASQRRDLIFAGALGLLFFGVFPWLFALSLVYTTAARGSLAMSTFPLSTLALAIVLRQEVFTWRRLIGILIAMGGLAYALSPKLAGDGVDVPDTALKGDLIMVFAVFLGSIYGVLARPYMRRVGPLPFTAVGLLAGAMLLILMAIVIGGARAIPQLSGQVWATITYLGIVGTAMLFWLWGVGIRYASPALVALTVTANPLVATILGATMLGEPIGVEVLIGLTAVLVGIIVVSDVFGYLRTRLKAATPV
ncbi:MAG: DMT family transporter [Burkholderiales bacterium]